MQRNTKKHLVDGFIQFTIFLTLIGVRVDVDSYLNGHNSPLIEIDGGPSSAFIQTPFHHFRDTAAGYHVHPKCPELEDYFTSRRLLSQVRALGSPIRFPTRLSAWLVQLVPNGVEPEQPHLGTSSDITGQDEPNQESRQNEIESHVASLSFQGEEEDVKDEEDEITVDSLNQLTQSSTLEQEVQFGSSILPLPLSGHELHSPWVDLLSNFDDFDSLVSQHMSELDADLQNPIGFNASLQDAMVNSGGGYRPDPPRDGTRNTTHQDAGLFHIESTNSSNSDLARAGSGAILPFSLASSSYNGTSQSRMGGFLDEAVFDQINLLGLEALTSEDSELLNQLEGSINSPLFESLDSDSGLSLESCSRSPASRSTSSSESFCEDEGGAMGCSSDLESLSTKSGACASSCYNWPTLNANILHDHTYYAEPPEETTTWRWTPSLKGIKQEVMSEDESGSEEPSRDERRLQALGLPFSAPEIVNMPVEDFLELLESHGLSLAEVSLLRDVRRRGKNKLAAQNCRKRKMHAILGLQAEVEGLAAQRDSLLRERTRTAKVLSATTERFEALSHEVLRQLRDENGHPLNPELYTLHSNANGHIVVRPRTNAVRVSTSGGKTTKRKKEKKP